MTLGNLYIATVRKATGISLLWLLLAVGFFGYGKANVPVNEKRPMIDGAFVPNSNRSAATELHRFWLRLSTSTQVVGQTLMGYTTGATHGVDNGIDALYFNDSPVALTSIINGVEYIIQGRGLPFTTSDVVQLGFKTNTAETYTIALSNFDGLFIGSQPIYLKDKVTGTFHNLKTSAYTFSTGIGVFNDRFKIYYKSDTTTFQNGAWSWGPPTIDFNAIIADNYFTTGDVAAQSLTLNQGSVFTVGSGTTLTVADAIANNSVPTDVPTFVIEDNAAVLQTTNAANTGLFTVKRNSTPLFRQDYTLWSSPVGGQNLRNYSPQTLFNRFYSYDTALGTNGDYVQELFTAADINTKLFQAAKGYLIRMPNNWIPYSASATAAAFEGVYTGTLTNGTVTVPLSGANTKFNLVGNPYASPISIAAFLLENASAIEGTFYFWRKANSVNNTASGYATYTSMGVVSADPTIDTNLTKIQSGQGFFVVAKSNAPSTLVFNNKMRTNGATTFFKSTDEDAEVHRFWLDLSQDNHVVGQTLIAYANGATQDVDSGIDAAYFNDSPTALTSLINTNEYIIQGRSLPFTTNDVVSLGFKTAAAGTFTISLSNFDGLFAADQDVFLKDHVTNTQHNLKTSDYVFTTQPGIFHSRFEVQYQSTLGTSNEGFAKNRILISIQNNQIKINAGTFLMDKIELLDVSGRVICKQVALASTTAIIDGGPVSSQVLIVRVTTKENGVFHQKIMY